ncbi:MAG: hypothetical protein AAGJ80_12750, partial [Cyanobacteria bacterium J06553_1]
KQLLNAIAQLFWVEMVPWCGGGASGGLKWMNKLRDRIQQLLENNQYKARIQKLRKDIQYYAREKIAVSVVEHLLPGEHTLREAAS